MNKHHVWCNGDPNSPVDTCKWCAGPNGLHAQYPEDRSPEELIKKYFPKAVLRSSLAEQRDRLVVHIKKACDPLGLNEDLILAALTRVGIKGDVDLALFKTTTFDSFCEAIISEIKKKLIVLMGPLSEESVKILREAWEIMSSI